MANDPRVEELLFEEQQRCGPVRWDDRGTLLPQLRCSPPAAGRPQCNRFVKQPAPAAAAVATVRRLARQGDKATGPQYVRNAADWYEQVLVSFKRRLKAEKDPAERGRLEAAIRSMVAVAVRHRWRHVLRATFRLAQTLPDGCMDRAVDDEAVAERRTGDWVDRKKGSIPVGLAPLTGLQLRAVPDAWRVDANRVLSMQGRPGDLELACGMYFMHAFHALAGLKQVDLLDDSAWHIARFWRRPHTYRALLHLLRHSCTVNAADDFSIRRTADLIVAGLSRLPLFAPPFRLRPPESHPEQGSNAARLEAIRAAAVAEGQTADASVAARHDELCQFLPPQFGPYAGGLAPHLEHCAAGLPSADAKRRLRMVHHVAEMVVDIVLDTLKVRPVPEPGQVHAMAGFDVDCHTYFHSLGHGRDHNAEAEDRERIAASAPPGTATSVDEDTVGRVGEYRLDKEKRFSYLKEQAWVKEVWRALPPLSAPIPASAGGVACAWCVVCHGRKEA